jgi:hypothetical protein
LYHKFDRARQRLSTWEFRQHTCAVIVQIKLQMRGDFLRDRKCCLTLSTDEILFRCACQPSIGGACCADLQSVTALRGDSRGCTSGPASRIEGENAVAVAAFEPMP